MKSLLGKLTFYVIVVVFPLLLPLLFVPFGINLVRYATANECSGEQVSMGRECIGRLTAEVIQTGANRVPRDACDGYACTAEYKDKHYMLVRLPDGSEQRIKGVGTFDGFTSGEKIRLISWDGRFIYADDDRPDHRMNLNAWYPGFMLLTLIGGVIAWLMLMHPIFCWARDKYVRKLTQVVIKKHEIVIAAFAPLAALGAIGFLLLYGITSGMLL